MGVDENISFHESGLDMNTSELICRQCGRTLAIRRT